MKRIAFLFGVLVLILANTARAESFSFSTDFDGTTLDSNLIAAGPDGTQQALDGSGHLLLFTSPDNVARNSDIWATSLDGARVTYGVDSSDTRGFTMDTVVTSWSESGASDCSQTGILLVFSNGGSVTGTEMFGLNSALTISAQGDINGSSQFLSSNVSSSSIVGNDVNVGLKVVRDGTTYTFSYQLGSSADWTTLGTRISSDELSSVGLFTKTYGGANISNATFDSMSFTIVPEPSSLVLMALGLFGLLAYAWRKRK